MWQTIKSVDLYSWQTRLENYQKFNVNKSTAGVFCLLKELWALYFVYYSAFDFQIWFKH